MKSYKIDKIGNLWTKETNTIYKTDMYLLVNWWTLKYDSGNDADDEFFLSLWRAVLGHEEDVLAHLDTVQVSQNTFFESI